MTRAPDGSPVELYARLPAFGEPELVHGALPEGCEILELGCGASRLTHRLVELGHPVVAVDQSAEMLARVRAAETVLADIETLDLRRTFSYVLLASNLVNTADDSQRRAFLETCRRHVDDDGLVLVQRCDPDAEWEEATTERDGVRTTVRDVRRAGDLISAVAEYELGGRTWTHAFTSRLLSDREVQRALVAAGLGLRRFLGERRTWLDARPLLFDFH